MSEPEARGPEDYDAPLEWRAPSELSQRHHVGAQRLAGGLDGLLGVGAALRALLYLFRRDDAVRTLRAG